MIIIREFKPKDLLQVFEIERVSFKDPYSPLLLLDLYYMHKRTFLVAEKNGRIVGYIIARIVYDRGHIIAIAVHPKYRRCGIGTALMEKIFDIFKEYGIKKVWLEVRVSNSAAIKFYKKLGFYETKIIKHYYRDGEDALVLEKILTFDS